MLTANSAQPNWTKFLSRFFTASVLSTIAILSGFVPEVSRQIPKFIFSFSAYAQDFSQEEVVNYAKAGLQVEMLRRQVYQQLKETSNEPLTGIECNKPESYQNASEQVRQVVDSYCPRFTEIVKKNNLSVSRYNEMKVKYDRQDVFYQQVQNILLEMQR
jgi:hypothetical protein